MAKSFSSSGAAFLFVEVQTGLAFAKFALSGTGKSRERIERNRKNARRAYDSLLRFRQRVSLSDNEVARLEAGIQELKAALQALGDRV
jgi:hypothetical protein